MGPVGEGVKATRSRNDLGAWAKPEVIRVAQNDARARCGNLARRERLDTALRSDGHERRRAHFSVMRREYSRARVIVDRRDREVKAGCRGRGGHIPFYERASRANNIASPYE